MRHSRGKGSQVYSSHKKAPDAVKRRASLVGVVPAETRTSDGLEAE